MKILVAVQLGAAVAWTALPAWSQTPDVAAPPPSAGATVPVSPSAAPADPPPASAPSGAPAQGGGVPVAAPVRSPAIAPPPSPASGGGGDPASSPPSPLPPVSPSEPPVLGSRLGFGIGLWALPGTAFTGYPGTFVGGALGVRRWLSERVVVVPSLTLGVEYESVPEIENPLGDVTPAKETVTGIVSASFVFGFAVYRGKTTRFLVSAGPGFAYSVSPYNPGYYPDGSPRPTGEARSLVAALVGGFSIEQFFSPRMSIALGADAPLLAYTRVEMGEDGATTSVSADFSSTRLVASVFFYVD